MSVPQRSESRVLRAHAGVLLFLATVVGSAATGAAQSPDVDAPEPVTGAPSEEGAETEETDATETEEPAEPAADARPPMLVIDAATIGVDPVVGRHVTRRMRATADSMGYRVLSAEETVAAAQRLRMPFPPSPADLWRVTYVGEARRGAFARVWAHEGRYHFELSVASLDGGEPRFARGSSEADDLHEVVERLTREVLPPPERWDAEGYERFAGAGATRAPTITPPPVAEDPFLRRTTPAPLPRRRVDNRPGRRLDVAADVQAAIGVDDRYTNVLLGARVGVRITKTVNLGVHLLYTNLRTRSGRGGNVLPMAMVENRIRLSSRTDITVPLRFAVGYLPFNGPVVRFSAGLNIPLSSRVELHLDLIAPTFWILPTNNTGVTLNLGTELIFRI
ncbi:MAG: hypothetical protein KF901_04260 [Myxococcales bacterium]|nr:hypothetical protein [Myxococcales bacterium]